MVRTVSATYQSKQKLILHTIYREKNNEKDSVLCLPNFHLFPFSQTTNLLCSLLYSPFAPSTCFQPHSFPCFTFSFPNFHLFTKGSNQRI